MFLYFYLLHEAFFQEKMKPGLAESWRLRSFSPCKELCKSLVAKGLPADSLVNAILSGLLFDRHVWQALVGECLVHGAAEIPRPTVDPVHLSLLFGIPNADATPRGDFKPIQQVLFGTSDLKFGGGYYRPDHAGLNSQMDVRRLNAYLRSVDPNVWSEDALADLSVADRHEELIYLQEGWADLLAMYDRAMIQGQAIVCEII